MPFLSTCNATDRKRLRAAITATVLTVALAAVLASDAGAATYFVDNQHPNSSAAGPGTADAPYYTISAAVAARTGPGVTIVVKPGIYREQVTIPGSGAPDAPFVIRAEGPGVIVDGADALSGQGLWIPPAPVAVSGPHGLQVADHAWLAPGVSWPVLQVMVDGRRLTLSDAAPTELPLDAFTWVPGVGLYVNLGGENPGAHEILVGRRASAFRLGARSWVTIEGFEVRRAEDSAINLFYGCTDVLVARNTIGYSNSYGIKVSGGTRIRIEDNTVSNGNFHGIGLTSGSNECTLRNNESFRNALPGVRAAKGIYLSNAPNNTLTGNRTYENQDTGIQINGGSHNCMLYNNRSWNNGDHGYDHLDATGTTHLNNVAYGNYKDGFSIEGDSPGARLYNCISTENGLTTGRFNLWVNAASAVGFQSGYNIIWNSTTQEPVKFMTTKYGSLNDFNAATGVAIHSRQADPKFVDAAAGDFRPQAGSPAIDAGDSSIPGWPATDIAGNPRYDDPETPNTGKGPVPFADIGAIEYGPWNGDVAPPLPLPLAGVRGPAVDLASQQATSGALALSAAYPNPSRGAVEFELDLPHDATVEWAVYDLQGRAVWSEDRSMAAGRNLLRWNGTAAAGARAATGIYLVRARVDGAQFTRRIIRF